MTKLFEPATLGDIAVANRIVMAPLTRNHSPNAVPNALNLTYYVQRASAGLIITEATAITHQGQGYADVPGLYTKEALDGWRKVNDAVHKAGGKMVVQMWHVGRISHDSLQPDGGKPVSSTNKVADAKTFIMQDGKGAFVPTSEPRALETAELPGIVEDYRKAARAAIDAGFDGVEIHAANGYLIDQFLRSGVNDRTDQYGGSIENRARFLFEVVEAVTKEVGAGRHRHPPVAGNTGRRFQRPASAAAVHLCCRGPGEIRPVLHPRHRSQTGGARDFQQGDTPFDYQALHAAYKAAGGKSAWMVNNGYDRQMAIDAVETGKADVVAFGRPFIANPDLVERLKLDAKLTPMDPNKLYGAVNGEEGYTDYPTLAEEAA